MGDDGTSSPNHGEERFHRRHAQGGGSRSSGLASTRMTTELPTTEHHGTHERLAKLATGLELEVIEGPDTGRKVKITRIVVNGGRGRGQDMKFTDPIVSEAHFELRITPSGTILRDLKSTNGTFVGKAKLRDSIEVFEGSTFFVGKSRVRITKVDREDVPVSTSDHLGSMYGKSLPMRRLFSTIRRLAPTKASVLIGGETGTGKEEVARALHDLSGRSGKFITLDCGALTATLAEDKLFGHCKGSFSGASRDAIGCFEAAVKGTLFIDEIAELPLELQPKLLRALDRREITRLGEHAPRTVDARFIAATHKNLAKMVAEEKFREDLYYRINTVMIEVPPLRERKEDIEGLAKLFLSDLAKEPDHRHLDLTPGAIEALSSLEWTGNIRQLKGTIQRGAYLADGDEITESDLRSHTLDWSVTGASNVDARFQLPIKQATLEFQRDYVRHLLKLTNGHLGKAGTKAGFSSRKGFRELLARLELDQT